MAEHCTQLGLPAREDYIFVAKALSQVIQILRENVKVSFYSYFLLSLIFTAGSSDENSVCSSFRLSVCLSNA